MNHISLSAKNRCKGTEKFWNMQENCEKMMKKWAKMGKNGRKKIGTSKYFRKKIYFANSEITIQN